MALVSDGCREARAEVARERWMEVRREPDVLGRGSGERYRHSRSASSKACTDEKSSEDGAQAGLARFELRVIERERDVGHVHVEVKADERAAKVLLLGLDAHRQRQLLQQRDRLERRIVRANQN